MKRHHYILVDSETTRRQTGAEFGAVVVGRDGRIVEQFGALVFGHFGKFDLFADPSLPDSALWSEQSAQRRMKNYYAMIDSGERSISSPALIQQWLWGVNQRYQPTLTAYNLVFDFGKCQNTRINLGIFSQSSGRLPTILLRSGFGNQENAEATNDRRRDGKIHYRQRSCR